MSLYGAGRKLKDGYNTWCGDAICGVTVQSGSTLAAAGAGSGGMTVGILAVRHKCAKYSTPLKTQGFQAS